MSLNENVVLANDIDLERGFSWDEKKKKLWVNLHHLIDHNYLIINPTSGQLTVNPQKFDAVKDHLINLLDALRQHLNEELIDTNNRIVNTNNTIERLVTRLAQEGNPIKTTNASGLTGSGTSDSPLKLNLNTDDLVINRNNQLELAIKKPKLVTNLNNNLIGLGFHTFSGFINNTGSNRQFVRGVPVLFTSEAPTQAGANTIEMLAPNQHYDFNGYFVASEQEVVMTIIDNGITWTRSNDLGMYPNGTIKDENAWSDWKRETNFSITVELIEQHTRQIQDLLGRIGAVEPRVTNVENRLNTLETQTIPNITNEIQGIRTAMALPCEVDIKHVGSYTVTNEDNVIVSNGGTITFPYNLKVGRSFTVIRNGGSVTLAGTTGSGTILHKDKSAASVVVTSAGVNMVFGNLK